MNHKKQALTREKKDSENGTRDTEESIFRSQGLLQDDTLLFTRQR
jgi:hypothetical protein